MPIVQHLVELRSALLRSIIAIALFFAALFPFSEDIYSFIAAPILAVIPGSNLIAIGVISPFLTPLKMSLILAIYLALPYLLFKIWQFTAPALYQHEKKLVLTFGNILNCFVLCRTIVRFLYCFPSDI